VSLHLDCEHSNNISLTFFIDPRWTVRLAPRAFSVGVVDSLGEGFVYNINVLWLNNAIR